MAGDSNIQEPLFSRKVLRIQIISSSIVGQNLTAGSDNSKLAQEIKKSTPHISLYLHLWRI